MNPEVLIIALVTRQCGRDVAAWILSNSVLFRSELCDVMLQATELAPPKEIQACLSLN